MKTMFDLNKIDGQGAVMNETTSQNAQTPVKNAIEVRNLNFFYGSFQGLQNINLDIEEGKVTAFIGPSSDDSIERSISGRPRRVIESPCASAASLRDRATCPSLPVTRMCII
jgi:hypothetical protein